MVSAWLNKPQITSQKKQLIRGRGKTRSLTFEEETVSSNCPAHNQVIALNINFKNNQFLLNRSSFKIVGKVATAMNNVELMNCQFLIEGHTNSIGRARRNLELSLERARTVKMLLSAMNIESNRLKTIGKGETDLLYPKNGGSAANRRVQFRILDPNLRY
jgi:outer membrane protein OmpA-like peptidoglycan-associated protein